MIKLIKKKISKLAIYIYLFSFVLFLIVLLYSCVKLFNFQKGAFCSIIIWFIYIAFVEIIFRIFYKIKYKSAYKFIPKVPFDRMYIEPHPYLPYVYKKKFVCQKAMPATYPLHKDKKYMFGKLTTNNFRHLNGPMGDRDVEVPKPKGLIRINCIGGSTTGNYIMNNGQNFSYPMELEKILKNTLPKSNIEVNNFGMGGYTTAEILIKFLLSTIDTDPDIVIIYQAYNDLDPSLTSDFESDYSHCRRNLGEVYHLYEKASKFPYIPLAFWNYIVNTYIFSQNIRFLITGAVSKKTPDIKNDFKGLDTYKRNIEHIINICKANKIFVVMSTFCCYLYPEIQNDEEYLKYYEGVRQENEVVEALACKHDLSLVKNDLLIPKEEKYFVDSIHFTPEGMNLLAANISQPIIDDIKSLG